ncbi:outer membrane beta-barrel protein [Roseateles sp. BYS78W]|uniref:Outer membrane beta-barrel protein n=1 Tax=Pelomonas candidula TaxID=3299025 RepID=A0ABW7HBP8_9BURK
MKALFLATTTLLLAASAHAADPYVGINLATPGEANFSINGRNVGNDNHPRAVKLYAGLQFTPDWAAELGYGAFGSWHATDPVPGSSAQARLASSVVYLAARGSTPLGESFALFGRLGVAVNRLKASDSLGHSDRESFVRPLFGGGLEWKLAPQLSATVEYNHYGSRSGDGGRFTQQKAEVGLAFKF